MRPLRPARWAAAVLAPVLLLGGCAAGQEAETAEETPDWMSTSAMAEDDVMIR